MSPREGEARRVPACGHCRDLIANYLPAILDQYGTRLQILSIDAADPGGRKLFQAAVTQFDVPARDRGVPAVVIGDRFLSGTIDVSEELPILVAPSATWSPSWDRLVQGDTVPVVARGLTRQAFARVARSEMVCLAI